jgi:hypothetical protein
MPSIRNGNRLVTQIAVIEPEQEKRTELRSALTHRSWIFMSGRDQGQLRGAQ